MSRKQIYYEIESSTHWWLPGHKPVPIGTRESMNAKFYVRLWTKRQAMRVWARCPPGSTMHRLMRTYGKRRQLLPRVLREWCKPWD